MITRVHGQPVVFLAKSGELVLEMDTLATIPDAANQLGARYVVICEAPAMRSRRDPLMVYAPVWGVFDMTRNREELGQITMAGPIKTFEAHTSDAAVMWALAQGDR